MDLTTQHGVLDATIDVAQRQRFYDSIREVHGEALSHRWRFRLNSRPD